MQRLYCFKIGLHGLGYYSGEEHTTTPRDPQATVSSATPALPAAPALPRKRVVTLPEHAERKQSRSESPPRQYNLDSKPGAYHTPYPPLYNTAEDYAAAWEYAERTRQLVGPGRGVISLVGLSAKDVRALEF